MPIDETPVDCSDDYLAAAGCVEQKPVALDQKVQVKRDSLFLAATVDDDLFLQILSSVADYSIINAFLGISLIGISISVTLSLLMERVSSYI